ncbi:DUF447 domain-containing protein [Staphylothermus hellenicus]|uniref:DUF447 domain-containing protein n=1 Tax=Staphylothermus hellenicus (strain DSM 12710 / JCM 10830 / BK20S6-10-b1 / P8) TaxID=591019 RepID=D7D9L4_STAHD|nr:DUF447 domain-containing protein [Staphylothermus hellenicus]ADI32460.1 hypothetical protein Shell_1371 [Staphylothermus hellenicus DSM 12710]
MEKNRLQRVLHRLGFNSTTYAETILTISLNNEKNAAPVGFKLFRGLLKARIYANTKTYNMVNAGAKEFVVNITRDPRLFFYAIFNKEAIRYVHSKTVSAPRIMGCNAYIEGDLDHIIRRKGYIMIYIRPRLIDYKKLMPTTYNRAGPAIIEAIVYYTKIRYYMNIGELNRALDMYNRVKYCRDTVYHSTTKRSLRELIDKIVFLIEKTLPKTPN